MSIDTQILNELRSSSGIALSVDELSQRLKVNAMVIRARIEELRGLGYEIEVNPHRGCRLLTAPDLLHPDDLKSRLGETRVVGRDIRVFQETTSTSDVIEKLARDGVKQGAVAFAETQSKGRGRHGRTWLSPAGKGLWFSILLRPKMPPHQATQLTVGSAVAVRRAIHPIVGAGLEIKWPNDILIHGKKVAGILTELSAELDMIRHLTLGIGIDVNVPLDDFPPELQKTATSLRIECGKQVDRPALAVAILRELDNVYAQIESGRFDRIADEWEEHCSTLGRRVRIRVGTHEIIGQAEALGDDGALLLRTEHGRLERIIGGDLTFEENRQANDPSI
jgi:BirA family biotin operon repressor/biotin-[acetyl-CoA-carboxylase] ligase